MSGSLSKMLTNLANWLRRLFPWNRLTLILVDFLGVCFETWNLVRKYTHIPIHTHTYAVSENIPFSTTTSLILLISADHASGVRIPDCFKLTINWKMTMRTSLFADKMSSSSFLKLPSFSCQVQLLVEVSRQYHCYCWNYGSFFIRNWQEKISYNLVLSAWK